MMCVIVFCCLLFATSAVLSVTVNDLKTESCSSSYSEFRCSDGNCVNVTSVCDGTADCSDGSDEVHCDKDTDLDVYQSSNETSLHRWKRQIRCTKNEWRCKDGTCIEFHRKCDGIPDCPDGSDETFPLCRKSECLPHWFRCTYGACVDGTAPCNRVQDCADNSDELLPRCRNESEEIRGTFKCANGQQMIPSYKHCDGTKDCTDGSDETIRACAGKTCNSYLFQCAYGACVDADSDCNGSEECADGSDESDELCNKTSTDTKPTVRPISDGACVLPPFPDHGSYIVAGVPNAKPGQAFDTIGYNVTCYPGYGIQGNKRDRLCVFGEWSEEVGQCVRFCRLNKDASVEYRCILTGGATGTRLCGEYEPDGTVVIPECNAPNYYYNGVLPYMRCIDGSWDYVARCLAECGLVTPGGTGLIAGPEGKPAKRGELPWHTAIYRKTATPFQQICGGSLVSAKVAISAAHCFWNDTTKQQPPANYAVALGKIYRRWEHPDDLDVQRSDVRELKLPIRFQGSTTHFQDDIAVMLLTEVIVYMPHIRPVCIDFNIVFENRQLKEQNKGKVAGWGLTAEDGKASKILLVVELPYISIMECQADSPPDFRSYITGDKICAGYRNGTALCKGDSGGGLTFPESDKGQSRYYLRGIVSAAPDNDHLCNVHWLTTFTQISRHEHFIKQYL